MNHATFIQRFAFAQTLALILVGDACAQQQPQVAPAAVPHANACYRLSYSPDTAGYYFPALVQLLADRVPPDSQKYQTARWRGGDVQRQIVRESFKLTGGSAKWVRWGDSLRIESNTGLPAMSIHLGRLETAAAPASSNGRPGVIAWKGRAVAYLNEGSDYVAGDVSAITASCDTILTPP